MLRNQDRKDGYLLQRATHKIKNMNQGRHYEYGCQDSFGFKVMLKITYT